MTENDLLLRTYNMVLAMHQDWPRAMASIVKLETRVSALEDRFRSYPPRSRDLDRWATNTGSYHIPQHELDAMLEKHELSEDGKNFRALKSHGIKFAVGLAIAVGAALIMSVVNLLRRP